MRVEAVRTVLRALGSYDPDGNLNSRGDWLSASCPLAPWTHESGRDARPSMMLLTEPGPTGYRCMGCEARGGSLTTLIYDIAAKGGISSEQQLELEYFVSLEETKHYHLSKAMNLETRVPDRLAEDLGTWHPYWGERGFTKAEVKTWRYGYSGDERRALIPFWGMDGGLLGIVGRDVTGLSHAKYKVYPQGFERGHHLYNENRITGHEDAVLLVEGYLDVPAALRHVPANVGVVALGSAIPTKEQLKRLAMLSAREVISGLDNDKAGGLGTSKLIRTLGGRVKISTIEYGEAKDADDLGKDIVGAVENRRDAVLGDLYGLLNGLI